MSETHVVEKMETDLNTTNQSADSGEILTLKSYSIASVISFHENSNITVAIRCIFP